MKRKLLTLGLAMCGAVACALGLAACGNKGGDGGNGGGNNLDSLVIKVGNKEYADGYDLGEVTYGETPDLNGYKIYAKYSDSTETEISKTDSGLTVTYTHDGDEISALPATYNLGNYGISYTYKNYGAYVSFKVVTSLTASPYEISFGDTATWKYLEEPTITVTDKGTALDTSKYQVYYITEAQYDELKDDADFATKLSSDGNLYDADYLKPGSYYFYANVGTYNSKLVNVTVGKGALDATVSGSLEDALVCNYYTWKAGNFDKIKISEIIIDTPYGASWAPEFKNVNGETVSGSYAWANPDELVDCSNSGEKKSVKFVPSDDGFEEYVFTEKFELVIHKFDFKAPELADGGYTYYNGSAYDIKLSNNFSDSDLDALKTIATVTEVTDGGSEPVTIGEGGVLKTANGAGTYSFKFELKDKTNYSWYWTDYDDYDNGYPIVYGTDDKTVDFTVKGYTSWISLIKEKYTHAIDENLQVKIKINPGADGDVNNASPYTGLNAKVVAQGTEIEAEVEVVNEGGFDWIVITVSDFKGKNEGRLIIELTATGIDNYEDIYKLEDNLSIEKYSNQSITCPLKGQLTDDTMKQPAGITVAELYTTYPELTTKLGKWVLEYDYGNTGDWTPLGDEATLQQMTLSCRLVFKSDFVKNVDQIEVYKFTLIGMPAA